MHMNDEHDEGQSQNKHRVKNCCGFNERCIFVFAIAIFVAILPGIKNNISPIIFPPQIADTTEIKTSLHEISKLAKIDYYPMRKFSSAVWDAAKITTKMKYKLEILLIKTPLSDEYKNGLSKYFDTVNNMFKELENLSDESADFYSQQIAVLSTFSYSAQRMKRMVEKSDLNGLFMEIDYFIQYIDEAQDKLHKIKHKYIHSKRQAQQYHNQAVGYFEEMKQETEGTGIPTMLLNAFYGAAYAVVGYESDIDRFKEAQNKFNQTAQILDDCVLQILGILSNMRDVKSNLELSADALQKTGIKTSGLGYDKLIIDENDKDELCDMLDDVKQQFEKSNKHHIF
eukprot:103312_1